MAGASFPERRPYAFVLLVELLVVVVYLAAGTAEHFLKLGGLGVYFLANGTLTVLIALVLTRLRWWKRVGFRRATAAQLLWAVPMLLPMVINLLLGIKPGGALEVLGFLGLALMVGFVEEAVFRGVMLRALEPRGLLRAIVITTVLFSTTHVMNIMAGESGLQATLQVLYAAAIGFAFTAIVIRTGVIWPLIIGHAMIDFVAFLQDPAKTLPPGVEIPLDVAVTLTFFAYGLFVLRRAPRTAAVDSAVAAEAHSSKGVGSPAP